MRIRWIDTSCFEIETDQGKRIVTDPYIDECPNHPISSDDVEAMDYILISHTHFDHISQLDKFFEAYRPKILSGTIAGLHLLNGLDLSGQCMYGMEDRESLDFGDTRFLRLSGRHTIPGRASRHLVRESKIMSGYNGSFPMSFTKAHISLMKEGYYEFSNFLIETRDNTSILLWGGSVTDDQIEKVRGIHPDIILMQIPSNPADSIGKLIGTCGASYVIPHHHDTYQDTRDMGAMMQELRGAVERHSPGTRFIDPIPGKWYSFSKVMS
jgi:hypothetical protein